MQKIEKDVFKDDIVINMNKKLAEISDNLSIGRVSSCGNKIYNIGLSIQVKGNADIIKKLEHIGFKKDRREKTSEGYFVQIMNYHIYYDKYAIYKTSYGLRASLYIDNIHDFNRHCCFGKPEFPMIVNRVGGHCLFEEEYEKQYGFLYFKEVLENEEPLTREEMFPKNNENFYYGWIDPQGNTYTCSFENHYIAAEAICKELNFEGYNEERILEEKGWLRISRIAPYTPENYNSRTVYSSTFKLTKSQKEVIYKLGLENDRNVKWLLED